MKLWWFPGFPCNLGHGCVQICQLWSSRCCVWSKFAGTSGWLRARLWTSVESCVGGFNRAHDLESWGEAASKRRVQACWECTLHYWWRRCCQEATMSSPKWLLCMEWTVLCWVSTAMCLPFWSCFLPLSSLKGERHFILLLFNIARMARKHRT